MRELAELGSELKPRSEMKSNSSGWYRRGPTHRSDLLYYYDMLVSPMH